MSGQGDYEKFQSLFFEAPLPYQSLGEDGSILEVNEAWLNALGYSRDEVVGRSFGDFLTKRSQLDFAERFPRFKATGIAHQADFSMVAKDGSVHEVTIEGRISPFEDGEPFPGTHCIISDVHELVVDLAESRRRTAELAVRDRIAKEFLSCPGDEVFGRVLEVVLDVLESEYGVFGYIDEDGSMCAPSMTRSVWEECDVPDKDISFPRDTWGHALWARALRDGKSYFSNELGRVPEGHVPIHRNLATPIVYSEEVIGLLHVANKETDYGDADLAKLESITEYIAPVLKARLASARAEAALADSESRYRTVLESTPIGFLFYQLAEDGELRLEGANPYAQELTGRNLDQMRDQTIGEIFPMLPSTEIPQAYKVVAETGQPFFLDRIDYDDGITSGSYEVHAFRGEPGHVVVAFADITERIRAVDELATHKDDLEGLVETRTTELQQANRAKGDFLAKMSHELRTPLNSIIGFTGILRQGMAGPLNDEQQKQLGMVEASSKHLLELINEILDIERIDSGRLDLRLGQVEIADLVASAVEMVAPIAEQKGLELTLEVKPGPTECRTDAQRVTQVLINLLGNAVKFTDEGSVRVTVLPTGGFVAIDVKDTGEGIAPKDLDEIFGEFVQLGSDVASRPAGTGLGLTVSRRIARLLGGDVVARSGPDKGSTFTLTLPCGGPSNGE